MDPWEVQLNFVKALSIALLCFASLAVLITIVIPSAALVLGLGITLPRPWLLSLYLHPRFSLLSGLGILLLFGWAVWLLVRS
jgi:hypothetical protein